LVGVVLLFVAGFVALTGTFPDDSRFWQTFALGWMLAALASLPAVALLVYLDRRDPEPWWAGSLAYFWGAVVATGLGLVIRTTAIGPISAVFDDTATTFDTTALGVQIVDISVLFDWLETAFLAPLIEEGLKALALIVLVLLMPALVNGVRDGIVYGALVGLGFTVAETAMYIGGWYANAGFAPFMGQLVPRFVFGGINGHAVYSALFGAALGLSIETKKRAWGQKGALVIGGYLLAVSAHSMANAFGPLALLGLVSLAGIDPGVLTVGELWWLSAAEVVMTYGWAYVILGYLVVQSGSSELKVIKDELMEESEPIVTVAEVPVIAAESIWKLRQVPGLPRRVSMRLVRAQNRVAFRRDQLRRDGRLQTEDDALDELREEVVTLRAHVAGS
jgi:RsiW-degrading membrane proteinase PrsW (M82 family)